MSPAQFHDLQHAKKETATLNPSFPPLKIQKDSHFIKKSSSSSSPSSSSSSSSSSLVNGVANVTSNKSSQQQQQQRHPVIIYTHSPKIIHTHPKDFMALVQKLTGLSKSDEDQSTRPTSKLDPENDDFINDDKKMNKGVMMMMNDDNESTSVVTDENNGSSITTNTLGEAPQVNSCFVPPPIFDPPNPPCFNSMPFFNPNSTDFLCTAPPHRHQPFYNYSDSLFFMPNIRSSLSSSTLDGMKELPDF